MKLQFEVYVYESVDHQGRPNMAPISYDMHAPHLDLLGPFEP